MIVGIDLDGVLAYFDKAFSDMANKRYGRPPIGTKPVDWNWSNYGLTKEEINEIWVDIKNTYNFWEGLDVEPGVNTRLVGRMDRQHKLIFPTARIETKGASATQQCAWWLNVHFGIQFPTVFTTGDKAPLAVACQYDYFIDDRPKNCVAVKSVLPNCKVYLKDASHNQSYTPPFNIVRIPDINHLCDIVLGGGIN